jgi:hypothetical protein
MFLVTLIGLAAAALLAWSQAGWSRRGLAAALVCALGFMAGAWPREVGRRHEPHDAYREQFQTVSDPALLKGHAWLLGLQCLPRLIVGHRLPDLETDPQPIVALIGDHSLPAWSVTLLGLALFPLALLALAAAPSPPPGRAVCYGLLVSAAVVVVGFVLNRNIFNSDNYRYLVTLLVPWTLGLGLLLRGLARRGSGGLAAAGLCGLLLAGLMTVDTARWYFRLGWLERDGRPVRLPLDDPELAWLEAHPDVTTLYGDYWSIYRIAFLTGGRVRGMPLPNYPDRFPEWSRGLPGRHPELLLAGRTPGGRASLSEALRAGGRIVFDAGWFRIATWPNH